MFFILFTLSAVCGALVFIRLTGSDDWLARGLREDKISAVAVTCLLGVCAIGIFILLYAFLSLIPDSLAPVFANAGKDLPKEDTRNVFVEDIIHWFLLLCIPILAGYLLHWLYRGAQWVIKKSTQLHWKPKSWL